MIGPGDSLSKSTKKLGAMDLIKPVLDGIGIKEVVDGYGPIERQGDHERRCHPGRGPEQVHVSPRSTASRSWGVCALSRRHSA